MGRGRGLGAGGRGGGGGVWGGGEAWPREAAYSWWVAGRPVPGAGAAVLVLGPAGEELEGTEVRCWVGPGEGGLLL